MPSGKRIRSTTFGDIVKRLRRFNVRPVKGRGKGSHVIFSWYNKKSEPEGPTCPIPYHGKKEIHIRIIKTALLRFGIRESDYLAD